MLELVLTVHSYHVIAHPVFRKFTVVIEKWEFLKTIFFFTAKCNFVIKSEILCIYFKTYVNDKHSCLTLQLKTKILSEILVDPLEV